MQKRSVYFVICFVFLSYPDDLRRDGELLDFGDGETRPRGGSAFAQAEEGLEALQRLFFLATCFRHGRYEITGEYRRPARWLTGFTASTTQQHFVERSAAQHIHLQQSSKQTRVGGRDKLAIKNMAAFGQTQDVKSYFHIELNKEPSYIFF